MFSSAHVEQVAMVEEIVAQMPESVRIKVARVEVAAVVVGWSVVSWRKRCEARLSKIGGDAGVAVGEIRRRRVREGVALMMKVRAEVGVEVQAAARVVLIEGVVAPGGVSDRAVSGSVGAAATHAVNNDVILVLIIAPVQDAVVMIVHVVTGDGAAELVRDVASLAVGEVVHGRESSSVVGRRKAAVTIAGIAAEVETVVDRILEHRIEGVVVEGGAVRRMHHWWRSVLVEVVGTLHAVVATSRRRIEGSGIAAVIEAWSGGCRVALIDVRVGGCGHTEMRRRRIVVVAATLRRTWI